MSYPRLLRRLLPLLVFGAALTVRFSAIAPAQQQELIAVLDLAAVNAEAAQAVLATERLRELLLKSKRFTLVDRSQMQAILDEQALQQAACTEQECAVQVGRLLGVRKIVAGKLVHTGSLWAISAILVDVETAETLRAESIYEQGAFLALLTRRLPELAAALSGTVSSSEDTATPLPQPVQPRPHTWERVLGNGKSNWFGALAATTNGGAILAGATTALDADNTDGWVVRVDGAGNAVWKRTLGGALNDAFHAVAEFPDGGAVLVGTTASGNLGGYDGWAVWVDQGGRVLWERTLGGANYDSFVAVTPMPAGGALLVGWTQSPSDGWAVRVDGARNTIWERTWGGSEDDGFSAVAATADGGVLLAGWTYSRETSSRDGWAVRLDGAGTLMWQRTFGGTQDDAFHSVATLPDGGAILAGRTASQGAGSMDGWAVRVDWAGTPRWERTFGGAQDDVFHAVAALHDDGTLLVGRTASRGLGGDDGWTVRLDEAGRVLWEDTFGGAPDDVLHAVAPHDAFLDVKSLSDGGMLLVGVWASYGEGGGRGWAVKLHADGIMVR